ncbi:hypothetical protein X727_32855 [Mesorhizobium sp. L103C119B0]|uniref:hypothetical protein n=1 Tax=Mesorhizobium sp. L103C119B0 TaxID=1287085 RepID=UPI0003D01E50|nr:hypothetical protein [Mesorhizobium sp. L103C119B0]ESZ56658.1 hypothetical protein X727_32855 [Mesorhizobium sp. L103C119B0]
MNGTWTWDDTTSKFFMDPVARRICGFPTKFVLENFDDLMDRTRPRGMICLVWAPLLADWVATTRPFVKEFQIVPFHSYEPIWIRSTIIFEPSGNPAPSVIPIDDGWGKFHGTIEPLVVDPNRIVDLRSYLATGPNFRGPEEA